MLIILYSQKRKPKIGFFTSGGTSFLTPRQETVGVKLKGIVFIVTVAGPGARGQSLLWLWVASTDVIQEAHFLYPVFLFTCVLNHLRGDISAKNPEEAAPIFANVVS